MTAMAGGAADKGGNLYEHWWTARRIADILNARASRIRLEPPGAGGQGIEFELDQDGHTWAEQAKDSSSKDNWTLNGLKGKDVLSHALHQVKLGRRFRFVTSTQARQFATLCRRSRETQTLDEFKEAIGQTYAPDFRLLNEYWGVESEGDAWAYLRSIYIDFLPADALRELVISDFKHLFSDDPSIVLAELRAYCDDNLHQDITAPQLWSHLESKGFHRRHLVGDSNVITRLRKTVERHRRHIERVAPQIGLVPSSHVTKLLEVLKSSNGKQIIVVDGRAGYGKSTIISEVASSLDASGWFVGVVRMDSIDPATTTSTKLGHEVGLGSESPAVLLGGVADGSPALFVIDQLDAVSTYSGRIPDVFESIDEILSELVTLPNVKVALVVRTVDLEADPRIQRLVSSESAERLTVDRLTQDDVRGKLVASQIAVPASPVTLELLQTPLHLSIFLRLSAAAQKEEYPALQDLYDKYTEELRVTVEREVAHLEWSRITELLVENMNQNERLSAPVSVLNSVRAIEWHALESAELLVRDANFVSFFHESYFDYLFAQAFVGLGQNLVEFLSDSGQHLFRRAQTRQILEHLAATDRLRFRSAVVELFRSEAIRSHLKEVVADVLGGIEPVADDWLAIDEIAWSDRPTAWRLLRLAGRPGWFEAVDSVGKWQEWLADSERVNRAFNQLLTIARDRPARVVDLLHPFVGESSDWRLRLKSFVEWSLKPESTDFAVELIERGDLDDARGPIAINSDFWSIVFGLAQDDEVAAAKLVGAYLRRALVRARSAGSDDPFASGDLPDHSQSDGIILQIAAGAPLEYLDQVLPFVETVAMAGQSQPVVDRWPIGKRWAYRHRHTTYSVHDKVFEGIERALEKACEIDPSALTALVHRLATVDSEELRFLACRALTFCGPADHAIGWLIDDPKNLALGWVDSNVWASRELIETWSAECSEELLARLESMILEFRASWEARPHGWYQYQLLSVTDAERLSGVAKRRLEELKRLFTRHEPRPPRGVRAEEVASPISNDAAVRMSDDHWLRALRKYNTESIDWKGGRPVGGAHQVAQVLEARARMEPDRFAMLALKLDGSVHWSAMDSIIRSIAVHVGPDILASVCEHAKGVYGSEAGRAICNAAQQLPTISQRILALVTTYVDDPDPDREWAATTNSSGAVFFGGELDSAGLNSTRGQVGVVVAKALFESADAIDLLGPLVERLAEDPVLGVRVCAAEAVLALMNHDEERAFAIAETLLSADDTVFGSSQIERLLTYLVIRRPDRFGPTLSRALNGPESIAKRAGRIWAQADYRDALPVMVSSNLQKLSVAARSGVAEMYAANISESSSKISPLFNDEDGEVRTQAAWAMRRLDGLSDDQVTRLIDEFLESRAFEEHFDNLVNSLEEFSGLGSATALTVCERVVSTAGNEMGNISSARGAIGQPIIKLVLRIYRQGDSAVRLRCLNIIDRLSEVEAYGVREALQDER